MRKAIQTLNESASVLEGARILTECFAYSEKHHSSPAATEYAMAALGALLEACAQRADGAAAQLDRILKA